MAAATSLDARGGPGDEGPDTARVLAATADLVAALRLVPSASTSPTTTTSAATAVAGVAAAPAATSSNPAVPPAATAAALTLPGAAGEDSDDAVPLSPAPLVPLVPLLREHFTVAELSSLASVFSEAASLTLAPVRTHHRLATPSPASLTTPAAAAASSSAAAASPSPATSDQTATTTAAPSSVVVLGSMNIDLLANLTTFPAIGTTTPALSLSTKHGGKGANAAVAIARLGVPVSMVGRVGADEFGALVLRRLAKEAVDTTQIAVDPSHGTGVAMILVADDGSGKTTVPCLAANMQCSSAELDRCQALFAPGGMLVLQLETPMAISRLAARRARQAGLQVVLKCSPLESSTVLPPDLLDFVDTLVVNEWEAPLLIHASRAHHHARAQQHAGEELPKYRRPLDTLWVCRRAAHELLALHPKLAVVVVVSTFGSVFVGRGEDKPEAETEVEAENNTARSPPDVKAPAAPAGPAIDLMVPPILLTPIDIIGAADAFVGGYVAARAEHLPQAFAAVWATCCGIISTQAHGAQESMPHRATLAAFMEERSLGVDPQLAARGVPLWPSVPSPAYSSSPGAALVAAVQNNDAAALRARMDELSAEALAGALRECVDFQGQTLLHLAVIAGCSLPCVLELLGAGADPGQPDRWGLSPLRRAAEMLQKKQREQRWTRTFGCALRMLLAAALTDIVLGSGEEDMAVDSWTKIAALAQRPAWAKELLEGDGPPVQYLFDLFFARRGECEDLGADDERPELGSTSELAGQASPLALATLEQALAERLVLRILHHPGADGDAARDLLKTAKTAAGETILMGAAFAGQADLIAKLSAHGHSTSARCSKKRTLLHFAAVAHKIKACQYLLSAGMQLEADAEGFSPLDLPKNEKFRNELATAGGYKELFVSYGHHEDVRSFTDFMLQHLNAAGILTWIDRNSIHCGDRWQERVGDAVRKCEVFALLLTQKWLSSDWCAAELGLAVEYQKPILLLLPPVSSEQTATMAQLLERFPGVAERHVYDFAALPEGPERDSVMQDFCSMVTGLSRKIRARLRRVSLIKRDAPQLQVEAPTGGVGSGGEEGREEGPAADIAGPAAGGDGGAAATDTSAADNYVFVACASAHKHVDEHLARDIHRSLLGGRSGLGSCLGFKGHSQADLTLRISAAGCVCMVVVVGSGDDQDWLCRQLNVASSAGKPVVIVPFATLPDIDRGLVYAAFTKEPLVVSFVDWQGQGLDRCGKFSCSSSFRQAFAQLERCCRDLARRTRDQPDSRRHSLLREISAGERASGGGGGGGASRSGPVSAAQATSPLPAKSPSPSPTRITTI